jgi:hypothetical protein
MAPEWRVPLEVAGWFQECAGVDRALTTADQLYFCLSK